MIWLKRCLLTVVTLTLLLCFLAWLAVSRIGSPTLLGHLASYIPALSIGNISGGLTSTLTLDNVAYQSDGMELSVGNAQIRLKWRCVFQLSVCVESLQTKDVKVILTASEQPSGSPSNELITLPSLVAIDKVLASNTQLFLPDSTHISLASLESEFRIYRRWRLLSPRLEGLSIAMPEQVKEQAAKQHESLTSREDIQLSNIFIPLNAEIVDFQLYNANVQQGDDNYQLTSIHFDGDINGHQIDATKFQIKHKDGTINGRFKLQAADEFPLDAVLGLNAKPAELPALSAEAKISGSLQNVRLSLTSLTPVKSALQATISPLKSSLPIDMIIGWEGFNEQSLLPLSLPSMNVSEGQVKIVGNLQDYLLEGNTQIDIPQLPTPAKISLTSQVNPQRANISQFSVELLSGSVSTSGLLHIAEHLDWQFTTKINSIDAQLFDARLPTDIHGKLEYQGQWINGQPNVNIQSAEIQGIQLQYPLSLVASGAYSGTAGVAVSSFRLAHKENHVQGFARLLTERRIDADLIVSIGSLNQSVPDLEGEIRGNILAMGNPTNPDIELTLNATDLFNIDSDGLKTLLADNAKLNISGSTENQSLQFDYTRDDLGILMQSDLQLGGSEWTADINQLVIVNQPVDSQLAEPATLKYDVNSQQITSERLCLEINNEGEACLLNVSASAQQTNFTIDINDVAIEDWLALSPSKLPVSSADAQLSAMVQGQYSKELGLLADAEGEISSSNWVVGEKERNFVVQIDPSKFKFNANQHIVTSNLAISSQTIGNVSIQAEIDTTPKAQQISAEVVAQQVNLEPFAYLSKDINKLAGVFNAHVKIDGELFEPQVEGTLQLSDGVFDVLNAPTVVTGWNAKVDFNKLGAAYTSDFKLGGGEGSMSGTFGWSEQFSATANLSGDKLKIDYQDINLSFSPDIVASFEQQQLVVKGSVTVPEASITLKQLPENAVTPSNDVHLRGEPEPSSVADRAEIDLQLFIDPQREGTVELDAFGLKADLAGQLQLTTQPSVMGFGDLQILNGEYRAYGQELIIRAGEVQFNGPFSQPLLFIEAIRDPQLTEDGVIAGIVIDGTANQPNIRLFSEPAMNQSANLAYLLSGRGNVGGSEADNNAFASLLVGFGVSNSEGLTGGMGEALGISDLQLAARGSGSDTQVAVSGTIAPNLTLEYGVGVFDSASEVKLRYKLAPKLFIEATSGLHRSLILFYEFAVGEVRQVSPTTTPDT